jgi:hypothetical protein
MKILRTIIITVFLVGCSSISTSTGVDTNLTGSWNGMWQYSHFAYEEKFTFQLTQQDRDIVGVGIDEKGVNAEIVGRVKNNYVKLTLHPEDGSDPIQFKGKVENNGMYMQGKFSVGNTAGIWFAKR